MTFEEKFERDVEALVAQKVAQVTMAGIGRGLAARGMPGGLALNLLKKMKLGPSELATKSNLGGIMKVITRLPQKSKLISA